MIHVVVVVVVVVVVSNNNNNNNNNCGSDGAMSFVFFPDRLYPVALRWCRDIL